MLTTEDINFSYGDKGLFNGLSVSFAPGCFYGIIGPNGSGKSTLVDLLCGHLRPGRGMVTLSGRRLDGHSRKALARRIALVPQELRMDFPFTCYEMVMMGRYPHIPRFAGPGEEDHRIVAAVLDATGLAEMADRCIQRLSGGERQRVVFARALAQQTDVLLLDEATAHQDMQYALGLLNLVAGRAAQGGLVIAVMQDLNLAALYCDKLVCLHQGRLYAAGPTAEVLTSAMLRAVFRVEARITRDPDTATRRVAFARGAAKCA